MRYLYIAEHKYGKKNVSKEKIIGVYSSEQEVHKAIEKVSLLPGFCDHLDGFDVKEYKVDEDYFSQGFSLDKNIHSKAYTDYIFVVEHCDNIFDTPKLIGLYSTRQKATDMIKKIYELSDFCESVEGFEVIPGVLDDFLCSEYILPEKWKFICDETLRDDNRYIYLVESINKHNRDKEKEYVGCGFFSTREKAEQCIQHKVSKYLKDYPVSEFYIYPYKLDADNFD